MKYHKLLIFIVNFILFIFGAIQVGLSVSSLDAGAEGAMKFSIEVLGNENLGLLMLVSGVALICISFLGCLGVQRKSKCILLIYASIFFIVVLMQAGAMWINAMFSMYCKPIHGSMWNELDNDSVMDIEETFECCSFNGTDTQNTWVKDVAEYENCTSTFDWSPMETCWEKFGSKITATYHDLEHHIFIMLFFQLIVCIVKLYLIPNITASEKITTTTTEGAGDVVHPSSTTNAELTVLN
jgi:hypothetical protein